MPSKEAAVSSDAMRAEADQLNASAREATRTAREQDRPAAQLAHEAGLIGTAAKAAHDKAEALLPRFEDKVTAALADKRAAEDQLNADRKRLGRRESEERKPRPTTRTPNTRKNSP